MHRIITIPANFHDRWFSNQFFFLRVQIQLSRCDLAKWFRASDGPLRSRSSPGFHRPPPPRILRHSRIWGRQMIGQQYENQLTWVRTLCELGTEVEHLVEELVPGQVAEEDERCLAVGCQAAEPKGPLRLQVREHEWEVLHILPANKNPNCDDSKVQRCTVAVLLAG